jgi:inner membrane protein
MPSPIGHGLAGLAIGFAIEPVLPESATSTTRHLTKFALIGAIVAAMADADLVYSAIHRGMSHSIGATVLLMIITGIVTGWVTGRVQWRWVILVGAAHASHILMDWLGTDRYPPIGLEALWPFSREFYISGWDVFPPTERRVYLPGAVWTNVRALVAEVGIMGPIAVFSFMANVNGPRRTRKSRVLTSVQDTRQRPSA